MIKKICLLLCLVTLFLYGCEKESIIESALPINSQLSETELSELELNENQYAVKLYGNLPPFLHIIRDYGSIDAYEESLRAEQKSMEDNSEIVIINEVSGSFDTLVYPSNQNDQYRFICNRGVRMGTYINNPKHLLDKHLTLDGWTPLRYKIQRIIFLKCENTDTEYFEYIVYYETNKGTYVLFYQKNHKKSFWVVPLELVIEKCDDEWPCLEYENGRITDSYFSFFGHDLDYSIDVPEDYE